MLKLGLSMVKPFNIRVPEINQFDGIDQFQGHEQRSGVEICQFDVFFFGYTSRVFKTWTRQC